jgi:integrase
VISLLSELSSEYERLQPRSLAAIRSRLGTLSRYVERNRTLAKALKRAQIVKYQRLRQRCGAAPATINREVEILRGAFTFGAENEVVLRIPKFPMLDQRQNERTRVVTPDEYESMRDVLRFTDGRLRPEGFLWVAMYHTGQRQGQLMKLSPERIDWSRMVLRPPLEQRSSKRVGHSPIYGEWERELLFWEAEREAKFPNCQWVFRRGDQPMKDYASLFKRARKRLGLEDLQFYDLRRSALLNAIKAGYTQEQLLAMFGWVSEKMLRRYFQPDAELVSRMREGLTTELARPGKRSFQ